MLAWLQARRAGGRFVLRIEDIDPLRTLPDGEKVIIDDLRWLGLDWDEGPGAGGPHAPYAQSARREQYRAALEALKRRDLVYPCTCSRKDIKLAGAPHVGEEGPIYPGICREGAKQSGRAPAWRFRARDADVAFTDAVLGQQVQNPARQVGDFVVWRVDDWPSYQLAVTADDAAMGITDVVRGADLLSSVGRQVQLFDALGAPAPRFHHVPLWLDEKGERLAKRDASQTVEGLRLTDERPEVVLARMAHSLGWAGPGEISLAELLHSDFGRWR